MEPFETPSVPSLRSTPLPGPVWPPAAVSDPGEGPSTVFMACYADAPAHAVPDAGAVTAAATGAAAGAVPLPALASRVVAHLSAALEHDRTSRCPGWAHFEQNWEEGCVLHRHLSRAYETAGLRPRSAIRDEDDGRWHVEPVPLGLPLAPASQVAFDLLRIYESVGERSLLDPRSRCQPRHAGLVALASVIAVLEARDVAPALLALLRAQGWLDGALWTREQTPRALGQLFEFLASRGFRRLLGRELGARRAARAYARMMARLIPGIGRRLLLADVLWLVAQQAKDVPHEPDGIHLGQLRPAQERRARTVDACKPSPAAYNQ